MRTSYQHYIVMLDFMEQHGDLSKPKNLCEKRHCTKLWNELVTTLNSLRVGDSRSEEKWKKVWSDLKNNTKKKYAKIKAATSMGACTLTLTDIELRVMSIVETKSYDDGTFIPEKSCSEYPEVTIEENETSHDEKVPQNEPTPHQLSGTTSNIVRDRMSTPAANIGTMKHNNVQHLKWKTQPEIIEAIKQMDFFDCLKSMSSQKRDLDEYDHFGFMIASKIRKIENGDDREMLMNSIHNLTYEFHVRNKKRNASRDEFTINSASSE